ncbi:PREDICTED: uncharacterized protein LOC108568124 [Nicrophorus vespilloides]|uniref:Uncharacterized protein LOC108568124 n=1 Tax=Nicrophorus vespilloides TaxID=110193 RepID=A0ABM1NCJ5_NICVS|nr:PREDICTED: uncharacterized protein LOC108568124 [Nicrophorus vespilloides]XP_017784545.1 PREDICTED: uncharacterized protein LOC108568124 [Nicrophorus vespilloides]
MALSKIKEDLLVLGYPNIQLMDDEDVAEVFNAKRRTSFLKWFLDKVGGFILPADEKKLHSILGDTLSDLGLCLHSQKDKFVNGDLSLNIADQFTIFLRILDYLKVEAYGQEISKNKNHATFVKMEELEDCVNMDINLFYDNGPFIGITQNERNLKMNQLEDKINMLEIDELITEDVICDVIPVTESFCNSTLSLQFTLHKFYEVVDNLYIFDKTKVSREMCDEHFDLKLYHAKKIMESIKEYIQNINTIIGFQEQTVPSIINMDAKYLKVLVETTESARELINIQNLFK